jgi:hypothetical protein
MAGLVPAIHVFASNPFSIKTWMPATSAGMTKPVFAMRIATWNVNSIKQRIDSARTWLAERQPDIVSREQLAEPIQGSLRLSIRKIAPEQRVPDRRHIVNP